MNKRKKHLERRIKSTALELGDALEMVSELGLSVAGDLADKAVNSTEGIISRFNQATPQTFKHISNEIAPFANPDIFMRLLKRQLEYYKLIGGGEESSAYERLVNSEIYLDMPEGEILKVRKPRKDEAGKLAYLYSEGLSEEDIRTRFFVGMSKDKAMQYGLQSSSILTPEAVDFVAVTEKNEIIGHAGYAYDEEGDASLHIVLHRHWRRPTANGDRISEIMFSRSLAAAMLDGRVKNVHAEALNENVGINRLIDNEMVPHGATKHNEESYSVMTIEKCVDNPDDIVQ
jgi:hypothetical protein